MDTGDLDELNYLLLSGCDRIGALDFQISPSTYQPRLQREARLEDLLNAAEAVEAGAPLSPELDDALHHGTSIGGARPKAQFADGNRKLIAKFSAARDTHNVVQGEYLAMTLAKAVGLDVAPVQLVRAAGKDVLLVERFDRLHTDEGFLRRAMVSSLTLQGFDEAAARYASYPAMADILRHRAADPVRNLRELWSRMLFNILVGNTDDHARNHACFWDGKAIRLTPAYDIDPRPRLGREANQAMAVTREDRRSRIATALAAAGMFRLRDDEAVAIAKHQIETIRGMFRRAADAAGVPVSLQNLLAGNAFLNPYAFEDTPADFRRWKARSDPYRQTDGTSTVSIFAFEYLQIIPADVERRPT